MSLSMEKQIPPQPFSGNLHRHTSPGGPKAILSWASAQPCAVPSSRNAAYSKGEESAVTGGAPLQTLQWPTKSSAQLSGKFEELLTPSSGCPAGSVPGPTPIPSLQQCSEYKEAIILGNPLSGKCGSKHDMSLGPIARYMPQGKTEACAQLPRKVDGMPGTDPHGKSAKLADALEVHCSQACQKRLIMFDQSRGRGRIFVRSALVQEMCSPSQAASTIGDDGRPTEANKTSIGLEATLARELRDPLSRVTTLEGTVDADAYRRTIATAFAALQEMRNGVQTPSTPTSNKVRPTITPAIEKAESSGHGSHTLKEDTEDLEALFSSDEDEGSTGHTPSSELTHSGTQTSSSVLPLYQDIEEVTDCACKRQKVENVHKVDDDGEVESAPATVEAAGQSMDPNRGQATGKISLLSFSSRCCVSTSDPGPCPMEVKHGPVSMPLELGGFQQTTTARQEGPTSLSRESKTLQSKNGSRKGKIKKTVKLLRSIIPGGEGMEVGLVLDEAIHYVRLLQLRVQMLETERRGD